MLTPLQEVQKDLEDVLEKLVEISEKCKKNNIRISILPFILQKVQECKLRLSKRV